MKLKREILLCYNSQDDQTLEGDQRGWVSNFHRFFVTLLSQINKDVPEVKLVSEDEIETVSLDSVAAVMVVETSALVSNGSFIKKLNDFGKQAKKEDLFFVDGLPRLFKVHKAPFEDEGDLSEFQDLISYDFYMIDTLSGEAVEFKRFFGNDAERGYWMKLIDMAYDISKILQATTQTKSKEEDIPLEKTVYLASTGVDMLIQRDVVKRELIRHGYKVLPNHILPKEAKLLEAMVKEDLHKCRLSIHMVGEDYGYRPTGSDLSVVDIQNRLASAHTQEMAAHNKKANEKDKKPFSRLVWLSPDLSNVTERQKIFIEDLKSEAATLDEAEVLQITLQELKGIIREELVTGGRFKVDNNLSGYKIKDDGSKVIYVIHDKEDKKGSKPLQDYLAKQGYSVVAPSFEGDLVDIRYVHQENLRKCDASIIYYGNANEEWIKAKLQDLLKAPGFGREKQLQAKAVYMEGSKEGDLIHFEKNNTMVLGLNGNFSPDHLKPFLNKIAK